jgi:hypothetical protein
MWRRIGLPDSYFSSFSSASIEKENEEEDANVGLQPYRNS